MKKVLVIAPYAYLPYFSGGQKFIAQFLHYLGKETDLTVISVWKNDFTLASAYKGIPLLKNSFSRYYDRSLVKKISTIVSKGNFDVVIWEHPYFAWLAFRIKKRTGVKTLIHTHNIEYQRFRSTGRWWWPVLRWYEKRCFKKADGIFFITPEDKKFAIGTWKMDPARCFDLPFGVDLGKYPTDKAVCRDEIAKKHAIHVGEKILLFTGLLSYKPNLDALKVILEKINPLLLNQQGFRYKILVCGKDLPAEMNELKNHKEKNIIYAGFTAEIDKYYKAADILLNPVQSGGGVKTKVIEAIANGTTVVSTATGATGVDQSVCNDKLVVVQDENWENFAWKVVQTALAGQTITPEEYYRKYNWVSIINEVVSIAI